MSTNPQTAAHLRERAETASAGFPALLAAADQLAASVALGEHGRRRSGLGDEFWQYRAAMPGDNRRRIDWRRSARSDAHFVQEKEWQSAQTVCFWVDDAMSMSFSGDRNRVTKAHRARVIALAAAGLLVRAGERITMPALPGPAKTGQAQLMRMAQSLLDEADDDFGSPAQHHFPRGSRAVYISDFLGDWQRIETALIQAADHGVRGALIQVLDPVEEAFPFDGRTIFESMSGALRHETMKASGLRDRYLRRLADRKADLAALARRAGWQYTTHHTDGAASSALLWLYTSLAARH